MEYGRRLFSELIGPALDWAVAKCEGAEWVVAYGRGTIRGTGARFNNPDRPGNTYVLRGFKNTEYSIDNADGFISAFGRDAKIYHPSTNWSQGGPIIERAEIDIYCYTSPTVSPDAGLWLADITGTNFKAYGSTPLIAAMRCYVASKLGDEVEVPEELS